MSPWLPGNECSQITDGRRCGEKIPLGRSKCKAHTPRGIRRNTPRPLPDDWQEIRRRIIDRDPVCVLCNLLDSTTADHKVDRADGGDDSDENLQGVCQGCHSSKTARTRGFAKRKA